MSSDIAFVLERTVRGFHVYRADYLRAVWTSFRTVAEVTELVRQAVEPRLTIESFPSRPPVPLRSSSLLIPIETGLAVLRVSRIRTAELIREILIIRDLMKSGDQNKFAISEKNIYFWNRELLQYQYHGTSGQAVYTITQN